jgi:hypothetical protein
MNPVHISRTPPLSVEDTSGLSKAVVSVDSQEPSFDIGGLSFDRDMGARGRRYTMTWKYLTESSKMILLRISMMST